MTRLDWSRTRRYRDGDDLTAARPTAKQLTFIGELSRELDIPAPSPRTKREASSQIEALIGWRDRRRRAA